MSLKVGSSYTLKNALVPGRFYDIHNAVYIGTRVQNLGMEGNYSAAYTFVHLLNASQIAEFTPLWSQFGESRLLWLSGDVRVYETNIDIEFFDQGFVNCIPILPSINIAHPAIVLPSTSTVHNQDK